MTRQCNATGAEIVKFPDMLPAMDRLTYPIELEPHENTQHSCITVSLAYIQQTFWIMKLKIFM